MVSHQEPDIRECEVKWGLGNITTTKANGDDGIPDELLQIVKDDAVKMLYSYVSKVGKFSSGYGTGKGGFLSSPKECQCQRMLKLPYSSVQFHSVTQSCPTFCDPMNFRPQQARPPCPSPTPGVHPNPCPLCQ